MIDVLHMFWLIPFIAFCGFMFGALLTNAKSEDEAIERMTTKIVIKQNPDKEHVEKVKEALKKNDGYCPCVITRTPDTKCMCKRFKDQIERKESGFCHCKLYYAELTKEINA